ncbi:MAG: type III secretion system chaperone [Pseudomonadota bacterium]
MIEMNTTEALDLFSNELETGPLSFDGEGKTSFKLDDHYKITIHKLNDAVMEWVFALRDADYPTDEMMRLMLESNMLGNGTGAARFFLDENDRVYIASRLDLTDVSEDHFAERFTLFVNAIAFWQEEGVDRLNEAVGYGLPLDMLNDAGVTFKIDDEGLLVDLDES